MTNEQRGLPKEEETVIAAVADSIRQVQQHTGYGTVEITVHGGRVTQIERREKVRFEHKYTST